MPEAAVAVRRSVARITFPRALAAYLADPTTANRLVLMAAVQTAAECFS